jgi:peptidoglycan/LPS O-acetylase OafA/YrhL
MRLKELDVLRGLAAVSVVMFHYTTKYREEFGHSFNKKYDWDYGHYGVQLFFIISGFVIFLTIQNVKSLGEFARKRVIRLYPAYWACLITTFLIVRIFGLPGREISTRDAVIGLTMFQGLFKLPGVDGAYWSLLPELLFYMFIGAIYYFKLLDKIRLIGVVWLGLMVVNVFYKLPVIYVLLNLSFGMFFFAGILFYRIRFGLADKYDHLLILCCLLTSVLAEPTVNNFLILLVFFSLFYLFVYQKLSFLSNRFLLFMGWLSYPLYLLHQNIGFVIMRELQQHNVKINVLMVLGVGAIIVFLAWIVKRFVEEPVISMLRGKKAPEKKEAPVLEVASL